MSMIIRIVGIVGIVADDVSSHEFFYVILALGMFFIVAGADSFVQQGMIHEFV